MKTVNKINQIVRLKQVVQRWRRRIAPAGSFAVHVGIERRRFIIPTRFLNLPIFVSLLNKSEEEFGYPIACGGIVLPCDVVLFEKLISVLEKNERGFGDLDFDDFTERFSDLSVDSYSFCKKVTGYDRSFIPLLQKARV